MHLSFAYILIKIMEKQRQMKRDKIHMYAMSNGNKTDKLHNSYHISIMVKSLGDNTSDLS